MNTIKSYLFESSQFKFQFDFRFQVFAITVNSRRRAFLIRPVANAELFSCPEIETCGKPGKVCYVFLCFCTTADRNRYINKTLGREISTLDRNFFWGCKKPPCFCVGSLGWLKSAKVSGGGGGNAPSGPA